MESSSGRVQLFDLHGAGKAIGEHRRRVGVCALQSRCQGVLSDFHADFVVLFFETEVSCHTAASGRIDYVPLRYSDFPRAFGPGGALAADVLLLQVPPTGVDGRISPGLCGAIGFDIIDSVPLAIAEVNAALPFTRTPVVAHESDLDSAVSAFQGGALR